MKKEKKSFVWVVTAKSESSDDYGPWVFAKKPTDEELKAFCEKECPGEFECCDGEDEMDGPGEWGSYLHISGPVKLEVRQ
jgi:hypothetical protein